MDFLHQLRGGPLAHVAVIVLTAFSEIDDAIAALKQQALDYLRKPVDLDELQAAIEQVLRAPQDTSTSTSSSSSSCTCSSSSCTSSTDIVWVTSV